MATLPLDVWLMIIDDFDIDTLWSTIRNVSQYIRECVDEFFRRSVLRDTVINLTYSTIHSSLGPPYRYIYLPMQFSHFSEDGTHAIFRQTRYKYHNPNESYNVTGSVRGWVPFVERYCRETKKPLPTTSNKSKSIRGPPQWITKYPTNIHRNPLSATLRQQTSLGRGDRPPYFILIGRHVHDTELVDLKIDCADRSMSINWRRTFSSFFTEAHFVAFAMQHANRPRIHDKALTALEKNASAMRRASGIYRSPQRPYTVAWREARRKRLQDWTRKNHKRMSPEHRYMTEGSIDYGRDLTMRQFFVSDMSYSSHFRSAEPKEQFRVSDLLVELHDDDEDAEEAVPEKCANDCRDLMMWPHTKNKHKETEFLPPVIWSKRPCVVL